MEYVIRVNDHEQSIQNYKNNSQHGNYVTGATIQCKLDSIENLFEEYDCMRHLKYERNVNQLTEFHTMFTKMKNRLKAFNNEC
ncbi:hypothetical protein [Halalkalibacter hemicellulosilyticus]|uniref:Uncharacterized protein n=1 Tax=Halalkalibacter hemicellulosilyticusJCM 9152 TaxID=1236971 RepID=W4QAS0_9BACI|nr:hypothetical protein [Halalkalibacter hemicellulosilyticus]GAE29067.1 hypothetical protein JCM9152_406 [Halalkalibacter hemicellulosilyticusJCM 9152]